MKRHLKRLAVPKSWHIDRKKSTFITRPRPGAHGLREGFALSIVVRDMLKIAQTAREVKKLLHRNDVLVNKIRRKDPLFSVGLMDSISVPALKQYHRVILTGRGKLGLHGISESESGLKPAKVVGKTMVKGKVQLNLYDGRNVMVDKDGYTVGDSVILDLSKKTIKDHIKLQKGSAILLIGGKSIGQVGKVEKVDGSKVLYKGKQGVFETDKKYVFVVGKDKPAVSLP